MTATFSAPHFNDDEAAREFLERLLWPEGPICRHCGTINHAYKTNRPGVYRCAEKECRKDFSVTKGTIFERSHIALHKWLQAFHLVASSKKGISAHQLHRMLGIGYEAAWFMEHRIREAMRDGGLAPLGGSGTPVEADETYFGKQENPKPSWQRRGRPYLKGGVGPTGKRAVVALVERGGRVRSFHPAVADGVTVGKIVSENIAKEARLITDESKLYTKVGPQFASHETVKHSAGEYVRGDIHTNSIEGVFSIFKRGMKGIYQHCREKHLHRYLAEFDFRYNHRAKLGFNDLDRTLAALRGVEGKRLTYHQPRNA
ncbi:MAG TPA: IS1595 family transposase [Pirellulaceae bacterium]|nr:IS1595 family transposase [Pirellulaceae bacterium]